MYTGKAIYTAPEIEILKNNYFDRGAATKCQKLIYEQLGIKRSLQSVRTKAWRMDLQLILNIFTEPEEEILRLNYFGYGAAKKCQRMIREQLGVERTRGSVQAKAKRMCLQTNLASKGWEEWIDTEDNYLIENAQKHSLKWLVKNMPTVSKKKRTDNAIARRCKILKVNRLVKDGWYDLREVAGIFGCGINTIRKLAEEGKLKGEQRRGKVANYVWEFQRPALKNFVMRYPSFLNGRRCDMVQIIDLASSNGIYYRTDAI